MPTRFALTPQQKRLKTDYLLQQQMEQAGPDPTWKDQVAAQGGDLYAINEMVY